jgi:hypothetical protein
MRWTKLNLICIYFKKLTYGCFKFLPFICTNWIDRIDFLHFRSSKIRVTPTDVVSSLSPPRCRLFSIWRFHAAAPCHTSFSLSQDKLAASASSSGNALSRRLCSQAEIETLNSYHRGRLPSLNRLTPTLQCYKKIISILCILPHQLTMFPFYLLPSQSTTPSKLHPSSSFPFTVVLRPSSLRTTTPTVMN